MPALNPDATTTFMKSISGGGPLLDELPQTLVEEIEELREAIRRQEGGGGMCHFVTEELQARYGWERLFVTYMSTEGEVICGGGHVVNVLPDGSILDPTRDQFGEGYSVSLLRADDPEIGRYRTEFYEDFNPWHPDAEGQLDGWLDKYDGRNDAELEDALQLERGDGWWLADKSKLIEYERQQAHYAAFPTP